MTGLAAGGRVLVTGASGFVGTILVRMLADAGYHVTGLGVSRASPDFAGADYAQVDLTSERWAGAADAVVHLAGLAAVGPSFDDPQRYLSVNSAIMTNVCEPLLTSSRDARVLVVSSGAVYGAGGGPMSETSPMSFTSPYAVSKVLVENQAAYYRARGLDTVVARPFNHVGPGQRRGFIVPDLFAKLSGLRPGDALEAGNLDAERDYTDVRDVAGAYVRLIEMTDLVHSVYNVASGTSHSGWDVLDALVEHLSIKRPVVSTARQRAIDPSSVVGDASRLRNETGWVPTYSLSDSIRDFAAAATAS